MDYLHYTEAIKDIPVSEKLVFQTCVAGLHPTCLPIGLTSLGGETIPVIKVPPFAVNKYGNLVIVMRIYGNVFRNQQQITDIVLPGTLRGEICCNSFSGCTNLRNITIPKGIHTIWKGAFSGCDSLENIYYEGTKDEWQKIHIVHNRHETEFGDLIPGTPVQEFASERLVHIPGNDALFTTTIHFHCKLPRTNEEI